MKNIKTFKSSIFGDIHVVRDEAGELWFIAESICDALGFQTNHLREILDVDEVQAITNLRSMEVGYEQGGRVPLTISESGMYSLVLKSRKPGAKAFKRWVTHEVLPSIRRAGGYMVAREDETDAELMARCALALRTIEDRNRRISVLEKENTVLEKENTKMLPSALAGESIANLDGTETIRAVVRYLRQKGLKVNCDIVRSEFRTHRYMEQKSCAPTMAGIERGYLVQKQAVAANGQLCKPYARVTAKGRAWLFSQLSPRYHTKKSFSQEKETNSGN